MINFSCITWNNPDILDLQKKSGMSDSLFQLKFSTLYNKLGRMPNLYELGADSTNYLIDLLGIKNNSISKDKLFDITKASSVEDALLVLNDTFKGNLIKLTELNNEVLINISKLPTEFDTIKINSNSPVIINNLFSNCLTIGDVVTVIENNFPEAEKYLKSIKNVITDFDIPFALDYIDNSILGESTENLIRLNKEGAIVPGKLAWQTALHELCHIVTNNYFKTTGLTTNLNNILLASLQIMMDSDLPLNIIASFLANPIEAFVEIQTNPQIIEKLLTIPSLKYKSVFDLYNVVLKNTDKNLYDILKILVLNPVFNKIENKNNTELHTRQSAIDYELLKINKLIETNSSLQTNVKNLSIQAYDNLNVDLSDSNSNIINSIKSKKRITIAGNQYSIKTTANGILLTPISQLANISNALIEVDKLFDKSGKLVVIEYNHDVKGIEINHTNDYYNSLNKHFIAVNTNIELENNKLKLIKNHIQASEDNSFNLRNLIVDGINNLYEFLGVNINYLSGDEILELVKTNNSLSDCAGHRAFIFNGEVYINGSVIKNNTAEFLEVKLHEMTHLLLGYIKQEHQDLYREIVDSMIDSLTFLNLKTLYSERAEADLLEETFVTDFSKFLSGISCETPANKFRQMQLSVCKALDTVFLGSMSAKKAGLPILFSSSIKEASSMLLSKYIKPATTVESSIKDLKAKSLQSRLISNVISDKINKQEIQEICN